MSAAKKIEFPMPQQLVGEMGTTSAFLVPPLLPQEPASNHKACPLAEQCPDQPEGGKNSERGAAVLPGNHDVLQDKRNADHNMETFQTHEGPIRSLSVLHAAADIVGEAGGGAVLWLKNRQFADTLLDLDALAQPLSTIETELQSAFRTNAVSLDVCDLSTTSALGRGKSDDGEDFHRSEDKSSLEETIKELCEETGGRLFIEPEYNQIWSTSDGSCSKPADTKDQEAKSQERAREDKVVYLQDKTLDLTSPEKSFRFRSMNFLYNEKSPTRPYHASSAGDEKSSASSLSATESLQVDSSSTEDEARRNTEAGEAANNGTHEQESIFEQQHQLQNATISDGNRYSFTRDSILLDPNWLEGNDPETIHPVVGRNSGGNVGARRASSSSAGSETTFGTGQNTLQCTGLGLSSLTRNQLTLQDGVANHTCPRVVFENKTRKGRRRSLNKRDSGAIEEKFASRERFCRRIQQVSLLLKYTLQEFFHEWRYGLSRCTVRMRCGNNYEIMESIAHDVQPGVELFDQSKVAPQTTFCFRMAPTGRTVRSVCTEPVARVSTSPSVAKNGPLGSGSAAGTTESAVLKTYERQYLNGGEVVISAGHLKDRGQNGAKNASYKANKNLNMQCVLLYRENHTGKRRLRICHSVIPVGHGLRNLYEQVNLWPLMVVMVKLLRLDKERAEGDRRNSLKDQDRSKNSRVKNLHQRASHSSALTAQQKQRQKQGASAFSSGTKEPPKPDLAQELAKKLFGATASARQTAGKKKSRGMQKLLRYYTELVRERRWNAAALFLAKYRLGKVAKDELEWCLTEWSHTYFALTEGHLRFRPRHVYLPSNLRNVPLLVLSAKKRFHALDSLVPRRRMSLAQMTYFVYPRCLGPHSGPVSLNWRDVVQGKNDPLVVFFDGQRMMLLINEAYFAAPSNHLWEWQKVARARELAEREVRNLKNDRNNSRASTAVSLQHPMSSPMKTTKGTTGEHGKVGEGAPAADPYNKSTLACQSPYMVPPDWDMESSSSGLSLQGFPDTTSASEEELWSNLTETEDEGFSAGQPEPPALSSMEEILRRFLRFRKSVETCLEKAAAHDKCGSSKGDADNIDRAEQSGITMKSKNFTTAQQQQHAHSPDVDEQTSSNDRAWTESHTTDFGSAHGGDGRFVHSKFGHKDPDQGSPIESQFPWAKKKAAQTPKAPDKPALKSPPAKKPAPSPGKSPTSKKKSASNKSPSPTRAKKKFLEILTGDDLRARRVNGAPTRVGVGTPNHSGVFHSSCQHEAERNVKRARPDHRWRKAKSDLEIDTDLNDLAEALDEDEGDEIAEATLEDQTPIIRLTPEELRRCRELARVVTAFLKDVRREMNFYSAEILFVRDRQTVLAKDHLGLKTHFLVEDETCDYESYPAFVNKLYQKLQRRSGSGYR
ncbi:unnamed protein product [Amoebophrya sp. A120]|nr:unnamed protein product [Amoebophrya sp. A120]|eukprot:GSA120T00002907001.1